MEVKWIFKKYMDNLSEEKLKKVPTEKLQAIVDSCDRLGDGKLCEICSFYDWVIEKRKEGRLK